MLPYEIAIRLSAFAGVFAAMAAWELLAPRRRQASERPLRWPSNMGLVVLDTVLVRILFPTSAVGIALLAEARGWGLLHSFAVPAWLAIIASVIVLDLAIYLQHVLFHAVPALWRLHRMHHADLAFDVTTGVRFHPIEILLSMLIKIGVVVALGAPALAVLIFEVLLNATSMFGHGNVRLPERLDRVLRWVVVTPEMHRVHHSADAPETNSNFGFNYEAMIIGIEQFRDRRELRLDRMLMQPFREAVGNYPLGRGEKAQP